VTARPARAAVAAGVLAAALIASDPPKDLARRVRSLSHYASQALPVRRLGGSSTDFDRHYFILLEWARPRIPRDAPGVAVFPDFDLPSRGEYLTIYELAPLPTLVAPDRIPDGWLALVYGRRRPEGWRVLQELPYGALLDPAPRQSRTP
jgi:hypothetical protein